jgi:osmotically-inducible protein OsmY
VADLDRADSGSAVKRRSRQDMRKQTLNILIAGAMCVSTLAAAPRPAASQTAAVKSTADDLENRIESLIRDDSTLKTHDISVDVDGSVATLTGTVATQGQKDHAAQLAHLKGITRVDNKIMVDTKKVSQSDAVDKTKGAIDKAAEKTGSAVGTAGEKTKDGVQKATSEVTDAYILSRVKSKFVGVDVLKGSDINVDADNQVVTLKGTVTSEAGRARAVALAKEAEGVKSVVDRLTIAPAK